MINNKNINKNLNHKIVALVLSSCVFMGGTIPVSAQSIKKSVSFNTSFSENVKKYLKEIIIGAEGIGLSVVSILFGKKVIEKNKKIEDIIHEKDEAVTIANDAVREKNETVATTIHEKNLAIAAANRERDLAVSTAIHEKNLAIVAANRERDLAISDANRDRNAAIAEAENRIREAEEARNNAVAMEGRAREVIDHAVEDVTKNYNLLNSIIVKYNGMPTLKNVKVVGGRYFYGDKYINMNLTYSQLEFLVGLATGTVYSEAHIPVWNVRGGGRVDADVARNSYLNRMESYMNPNRSDRNRQDKIDTINRLQLTKEIAEAFFDQIIRPNYRAIVTNHYESIVGVR